MRCGRSEDDVVVGGCRAVGSGDCNTTRGWIVHDGYYGLIQEHLFGRKVGHYGINIALCATGHGEPLETPPERIKQVVIVPDGISSAST